MGARYYINPTTGQRVYLPDYLTPIDNTLTQTGQAADAKKVGDELGLKQNVTDNTLQTTAKTVVGAINELNSGKGTYSKPSGGIPSSDMTTAVQTSLSKADSALQQHQDISGLQEKLIAGTNITIAADGKTISATGGGGSTIPTIEINDSKYDETIGAFILTAEERAAIENDNNYQFVVIWSNSGPYYCTANKYTESNSGVYMLSGIYGLNEDLEDYEYTLFTMTYSSQIGGILDYNSFGIQMPHYSSEISEDAGKVFAVGENGNRSVLLSVDDQPTSESENLVESGGVYSAIDVKQDKTDNTLATTSKTVVGAIGELKGEIANKANLSIVANAYDSTATYAVGDYCIHDGTLYMRNTAIPVAEAWTAEHWTAKKIVDVETPMKIKLAGTAITPDANGYVNIIKANRGNVGLVRIEYWQDITGINIDQNGCICVYDATDTYLTTRNGKGVITATNFDKAVKIAMCDGIGTAWTDAEKTGAWARLTSIKTSMDAVAAAGAQYYLGTQSAVSVTLPSTANAGQEIMVVFYSGATAATLTVSTCLGDVPTPTANQRIELNFLWDGVNWMLLSNSLAVSA